MVSRNESTRGQLACTAAQAVLAHLAIADDRVVNTDRQRNGLTNGAFHPSLDLVVRDSSRCHIGCINSAGTLEDNAFTLLKHEVFLGHVEISVVGTRKENIQANLEALRLAEVSAL